MLSHALGRGCGAGKAWEGWVGLGMLLGVVGCCFVRRGCVGSACNHNLGGAGPCRVGRKVGLGGARLEKGGAGRDLYFSKYSIVNGNQPLLPW